MLVDLGRRAGLSIVAMLWHFNVWASDVEIPLAQKVADESQDMSVFEWGYYLVGGFAGLIFLGLGLYALSVTGNAGITSFNDWRKGKEEFSEMATKVGIAIVVLVIVFVLIGYAYSIIDSL